MQLGIIGLPMVGKTTIFELLTESRQKAALPTKLMPQWPGYQTKESIIWLIFTNLKNHICSTGNSRYSRVGSG